MKICYHLYEVGDKVNIDSIKRDLLVKFPKYENIINNLNFIIDTSVATVSTDGKNIHYNPNFVNSISIEQQTFAFANVLLHIALNTNARVEGKDRLLWNIANDAVINSILRQEGFSDIENSINFPDAINCSAEEIYNKLLEEKNKKTINPEEWDGKMYAELVEQFLRNSEQNKTR